MGATPTTVRTPFGTIVPRIQGLSAPSQAAPAPTRSMSTVGTWQGQERSTQVAAPTQASPAGPLARVSHPPPHIIQHAVVGRPIVAPTTCGSTPARHPGDANPTNLLHLTPNTPVLSTLGATPERPQCDASAIVSQQGPTRQLPTPTCKGRPQTLTPAQLSMEASQ